MRNVLICAVVMCLSTIAFGANIAPLATMAADSSYSSGLGPSLLNDGTVDTEWVSDRIAMYVGQTWNHWVTLTWANPVTVNAVSVSTYYYPGHGPRNFPPRSYDIEALVAGQWVVKDSYRKTGTNITRTYTFTSAIPITTTSIRLNIIIPSGDVYDYINGVNQEGSESSFRDYTVHNYAEWLVAPNNDEYDPGFNAMGHNFAAAGGKYARLAEIEIEGVNGVVCGSLPGDINSDCYVDFKDFAMFAQSWLLCNNPSDVKCWQ